MLSCHRVCLCVYYKQSFYFQSCHPENNDTVVRRSLLHFNFVSTTFPLLLLSLLLFTIIFLYLDYTLYSSLYVSVSWLLYMGFKFLSFFISFKPFFMVLYKFEKEREYIVSLISQNFST